jgi:hypothetical protein
MFRVSKVLIFAVEAHGGHKIGEIKRVFYTELRD